MVNVMDCFTKLASASLTNTVPQFLGDVLLSNLMSLFSGYVECCVVVLVCFLLQNINQKPVVLRKRRQRIKIEANWDLFYYR